MSFDVTGMTDYIQGNKTVVMREVMIAGQSFMYFPVQEGIKKTAKLVDLQEGSTVYRGGDNTALDRFDGGAKLLDVNIGVTEIGISEKYSPRVLNAKVANLFLAPGSNPENMPFQGEIMGIKGNRINKDNEKKIWRGTAGTASFDGIETQMLASATAKKTGVAGVALTSGNALSEVNGFCDEYEDQLEDISDELAILAMSPKNFAVWYRAAYNLNVAINGDTLNTAELPKEAMIPGRTIKAVAMRGMTGSDNLIATRPDNVRIGTDLKSEDDKVDFRYESLINSHVLEADYKLGVAIARPEELLITKA